MEQSFLNFAHNSNSLEEILISFNEVKTQFQLSGSQQIYSELKEKTYHNQFKTFWDSIEARRNAKPYSCSPLKNQKVIIVGAGIAGLRTAIELLLLGADVSVYEKRRDFSRHNLLHLWSSSIHDLRNLGIKFFYPKFCTGGIDHISIESLQLALTKLALILGMELVVDAQFVDVDISSEIPTVTFNIQNASVSIPFQFLIGADGASSMVAEKTGFKKTSCKGSQAIGITCNFINNNSQEERQLNECAIISYLFRDFFDKLKTQIGIELENFVYYRENTHYFVVTVKKDSLSKKGIFKDESLEISKLLEQDNIERDNLEKIAREIADFYQLPSSCQFAQTSTHQSDVQIFDFSTQHHSQHPFQILDEKNPRSMIFLVGDALVEPFWPQGTGANRGIMTSLDVSWVIYEFVEKVMNQEEASIQQENLSKLNQEGIFWYKIAAMLTHDDVKSNISFENYLHPSQRYKKEHTFY